MVRISCAFLFLNGRMKYAAALDMRTIKLKRTFHGTAMFCFQIFLYCLGGLYRLRALKCDISIWVEAGSIWYRNQIHQHNHRCRCQFIPHPERWLVLSIWLLRRFTWDICSISIINEWIIFQKLNEPKKMIETWSIAWINSLKLWT